MKDELIGPKRPRASQRMSFFFGPIRKIRKIAPEASWVFTGQIGTAVAGLIGIKLLTHFLNPIEFGRLALATTIIAFIGSNIAGSFGQGLLRFWSISRSRGNLKAFYVVSARLSKFLVYATLLITIAISPFFLASKGFDWILRIYLSSAIGIMTGLYYLKTIVFTAARQRKRVSFLDIANSFIKPLFASALIIVIAAKANVALCGYLLASILILIIANRLYVKTTADNARSVLDFKKADILLRDISREILALSSLFLIWGILSWIRNYGDRWALQVFYGSEIVGAFTIVAQLAYYIVNFGSSFLTTLFNPIAYQQAGSLHNPALNESARKTLYLMVYLYIFGALILVGICALCHYQIIVLVSNSRYANYSYLLPWFIAALTFYQLGEILVSLGVLANRLKKFILPKIVSSVIAGVLNFFFSAKYGPVGIIYSAALTGLIYTPWCFVIATQLEKADKIKIPFKLIVD